VEVVGSRVPLTKAGREYKACCPFHAEKTASFWVSPEKQFYHCFGCGAHGTALRFLMDYDHMTFPEAVEDLAARLALTVPHEGGGGGTDPRDSALYDLMGRVAGLYAQRLAQDLRARRYLTARGLSTETLQRFGLGYAPDAWNTVLARFGTGESDRHALLQAGLIVERERIAGAAERHYDRFRDRIMFPIRDSRGRVIAFGGRVIDRGEPKYLNSPETSLFHKGRELYGLYESRSGGALKRLLVVEGYMDVVRLHQAGVTYAVATLGTATTTEHLKRIFRLVRAVVFAFDGDRAGRGAAWRALQHALPEAREGREIRFLFLPEGHDPDSLIGAEGRDAFEQRLESALPLSEYLVRELSGQSDLAHADGRARLAETARPLIAQVPPGVYRELLIARIAEVVGLPAVRLAELWHGSAIAAESAAVPPVPLRTARSAGRGGLVRQALARLVRFPAAAAAVTDADCDALTRCEEPGADLLRAVLDDLRSQPLQISAQVIERWRDRPGGEHLTRLLEREAMLEDPAAATVELQAALRKLAARVHEQRLKTLETKSRTSQLSDNELKEIQELTTERPRHGAKPPQ
jgi:DNA primase